MLIIIGIIVGAVTMSLMLVISRSFDETKLQRWLEAPIVGIIMAVFFATASKVPIWLAMLFLGVTLAIMVLGIWWWKANGSTIKELIFFLLLLAVITPIGKSLAVRCFDWPIPRWTAGLIASLPDVACVISVGFYIANMIWFKISLEEGGEIDEI